jgi:tetratricopeptide (TPR) repeat protein
VFCSRVRSALFSTTTLAALLAGCTHQETPAPERLAVIPFENLSSDFDLDWMRSAIALAVVNDLSGAPHIYAQATDTVNGAYSIQASQVLEGYYYQRNGRLEVRATLEDAEKNKTVESLEASGPLAQGVLPLVNELAKKLSPAARAFDTAKEDAFQTYGKALSTTDRAEVLRGLEAAAEADPHFSQAYLDWARALQAGGDRAGALKAIEAGLAGQPDPISRAKLEYTAASMRGDLKARVSALESLQRLTPADWKVFVELAQLQVSQREFPQAIQNYQAAGRLNPSDASIWNELGYAEAYAQDLAAAKQALEQYQQLAPPGNANSLDSLGEVSFFLGDFAGAAKYFLEADQKNRAEFGGAELVKAAQARLLAGDLNEADGLFKKYTVLFQGAERGRAAFQLAQWEFLTGRRQAATAALEKMIPALDAEGKSQGWSQLSIWTLQSGNQKAAAELAGRAAAAAVSPRARSLSALCQLIANPQEKSSGSPLVDAYALVFARKFAQATPLLERLYRETTPTTDGQIRVLLAWAYVETNRVPEAEKVLGTYPLPLNSGEPMFASLVFPRYLFLRGMILERQGKRAEAKSAYELFLKYSGDVPEIFGDDATARQRLSAL